MKHFLSLLLAFCTAIFIASCGTCKHTGTDHNYEHHHDSTVVHDTVPVPVHVIDEEKTQAAIDAFKAVSDSTINNYAAMSDSLRNALLLKDEAMQRLLRQIASKKFNLDPVFAETQFAKASAGVRNNELWLDLWQMPVDTILHVVNSHSTVTDTTVDTTTNNYVKEVLPPAWKNPWFYATILLLLAAITLGLLRLFGRI